MKCLLIELKDKRKFFTYEKNYPQLIEFCKSFKANLSIVNMKNGKILDLDELAPAFCNGKQKPQKYEYVVIENKIITKPTDVSAIYTKIQSFIRKTFLSRGVVSMKMLTKKYTKFGATYAKINAVLKNVKSDLEKNGFNVIKVSAGAYKIS
jgi:hypothetical protein